MEIVKHSRGEKGKRITIKRETTGNEDDDCGKGGMEVD